MPCPEYLRIRSLKFVLQEPQLGTGHAVQQALPHLLPGGATLILYGDVPLTRHETLAQLASNPAGLSLLTALLDDPTGYGRIVRDDDGAIARIVEEKDASAKEKKIREINTGMVCAPTARLGEWLPRLTNRNAQKEYYLTDIVSLAIASKTPVTAVASEPRPGKFSASTARNSSPTWSGSINWNARAT